MSLDNSITQVYQAIIEPKNDTPIIPNPMQQAVWDVFSRQEDTYGIGILLKGLTGSGKTEAVAIPALNADRRLIMVYPTRSLVEDQIGRFQTYLSRYSQMSRNRDKLITLTVDTGAQSLRYCWKNGNKVSTPGSERPTRHFHYGNVIITTLDKFLYRFFGFGEPNKSYIYPLRIRYMNPVICFDEAHSYENVAFTNFERLVRTLYEKGKDVVLMTATMPSQFEKDFSQYLEPIDFTSGDNARAMSEWRAQTFPGKPYLPDKQLHYVPASIQQDEDALCSPAIRRMIQEATQRVASSKRLIVTAESVKDAAFIFKQLRQTVQDVRVFLYHGRLTHQQRQTVYKELALRDKADQGYLLVSTSAIEVGCDLNAHVLITQLCDPDRLIQRAGRCNRQQAMTDAAIIVVGDNLPEWATTLTEDGRSAYTKTLQAQSGYTFEPADLIRHIQKDLESDPRVEIMFDMLYEYVYDAKLENKKLHDNGLVITRSWEPSITLCQGENDEGLREPITVPISYCRTPKEQEPVRFIQGGGFFKRAYDSETHRSILQPLSSRWENGYNNDIVVCLEYYDYADGSPYEQELGYVDLPFLFQGPFPRGARLILEHGVDSDKITIWYIDPNRVTARPSETDITTAVSTEPDEEGNEDESEEDDE